MRPPIPLLVPSLALILALILGACAARPAETASAPPAPMPETRAEQVALALGEAAGAERSGDAKALSRAVRLVQATGARPLEGTGDDPLPGWRARSDLSEPPLRGRPLGPGYRSGRIAPGGRESFAQLFLSGTASVIALSAPTGDRIEMNVVDKEARQVCRRQAAQSGACRWVPLFTQRYTIEVVNLGTSDARYFLVIE